MELAQGNTIPGKYRLERQIGAGGMGEVWAATQILTRKPVALKFLREPQASDPDTKRRFLREARAACAVRHPNVVQVHDVLELEDGSPVMVMELLEGESLGERLKRDGRMPLGDLAAVIVRVVAAVGTAHALGIVHRDLKPDNIFLAKTPDGIDVKVLDFGIAKLTALEGDAALTGGLTNTGAMLGTPYYMSPEQAFGEKKIDHRADIWSLGIILYRGLSGHLPTQADNIGQILKIIMTRSIPPLAEVAPGLPADVLELVGRMLTQDPAGRPQDLREVKAVLERHAGIVVEEFPVPASAIGTDAASSTGPTATPPAAALSHASAVTAPASKRGPLFVIGAVLVLGAAVIAVFAIRGSAASPTTASSNTGASATPTVADVARNPAPPVQPPPVDSASPATASASVAAPSASQVVAPAATNARPSTAVRTAKSASPTATAAAAEASKEKTSVGGVVTKPPF